MYSCQFCRDNDGYLAELDTRDEDEEVNGFLDRNKYYWIGLNDRDREGRDYTIIH